MPLVRVAVCGQPHAKHVRLVPFKGDRPGAVISLFVLLVGLSEIVWKGVEKLFQVVPGLIFAERLSSRL